MNEVYWKLAGTVLGTIGAIIPFWKKVVKPYMRRKKLKKEQRIAFEARILQMPDMVDAIYKQLFPNGGGSLFDMINNLKLSFMTLQEQLNDMEIEQKIRLGIQKVSFGKSNPAGEVVYVSPVLCKIFDREPRDLLRYGWKSFIVKSDFDRIEEAWESHIEESRLFDQDFTIIDSENKHVDIHFTAYPILDKFDGRYKGSYITVLKNGTTTT